MLYIRKERAVKSHWDDAKIRMECAWNGVFRVYILQYSTQAPLIFYRKLRGPSEGSGITITDMRSRDACTAIYRFCHLILKCVAPCFLWSSL